MNVSERSGIAIAGSVIVDKINAIRAYPDSGQLTQILSVEKAVGGCVPNVALDIKQIRPDMDVFAIGKTGDDDEGNFVRNILNNGGVDTRGLAVSADEKTSFTDVMSVVNGQRTFFCYPGACADFGLGDIDFDSITARILHLGYFLLLDRVDRGDGLRILEEAKRRGIMTSIDLVSENSDRYGIVRPCLPYTDYLIINETEAARLADMEDSEDDLGAVATRLMDLGVRQKVVIHRPECAVCCSASGVTKVGSYILPDGYIKGTTGAGDAFCAGTLVGIYSGWEDKEILEFASACAVMALGTAGATGGLLAEEGIRDFCSRFSRR